MERTQRVTAFRAFNRLWTARIGVLDARLHDTPYSLTEARVIFELAQQDRVEVAALRTELGLDPGYLSRILARFKREALVVVEASAADGRRQVARLTAAGQRAFRTLDSRSAREVEALLGTLGDREQQRLVTAMNEIRQVFDNRPPGVVVLRAPRAGDYGWVIERHGALYAQEYAWNEEFEALVARIVADYAAKRSDPREAAWIAELDGERAGCIFCVKKNAATAQLRLLLVEPTARGHGIGRRLVDECVRFARDHGYKRMVLWTNDVLHSARRIYEAAGFELVKSGKHHSFGHDLVEQTWQLELA
jgi:DNA-binding MarR family transcriptional regulator/N-acetylglutamate synthase-like GNAT family acetyltransferase